jgi:hypothetical protein
MITNKSTTDKPVILVMRLVLTFMVIVLFGVLLGPWWPHQFVFPGRTPKMSPNNVNGTALVVQASCLLNLRPDSPCKFVTDRPPARLISEVWSLMFILAVLACCGGVIQSFTELEQILELWDEDGPVNLYPNGNKMKFLFGVLALQIFALVVSTIWTVFALTQCWMLRNWMNKSGWLADKKELAILSFGAIVPFFLIIGTFSLLAATTTDGRCYFHCLIESPLTDVKELLQKRWSKNKEGAKENGAAGPIDERGAGRFWTQNVQG